MGSPEFEVHRSGRRLLPEQATESAQDLQRASLPELDVPEPDGDWWSELAALAHSVRRVLLAHPATVPLFSRPLAGPRSVKLGEALLGTLRRAGFPPAEAEELHEQLSEMVFALVRPE